MMLLHPVSLREVPHPLEYAIVKMAPNKLHVLFAVYQMSRILSMVVLVGQARKQKVQRRMQEQPSDGSSIRDQLAACLHVSHHLSASMSGTQAAPDCSAGRSSAQAHAAACSCHARC